MPSEHLSILACQIGIPHTRTSAQRDAHLAAASRKVRQALSREATDLVVLPELSSIEYSRQAFDCLDEIAEPLAGQSFETWRRISMEFATHVAFSFPRRADDGVYITLAVVDPAGDLVGCYDKIYLAQFGASMEKEYFRSGSNLFAFDIGSFRIGTMICADIRIPEVSRTLAIDGAADLILHCGAYFRDDSFHSWHDFVVTRALENQLYVLSLNRAGADYGRSMLCPPWIDARRLPFRFKNHREQIVRLVIEQGEIALARERYSFMKDRRSTHLLAERKNKPDPVSATMREVKPPGSVDRIADAGCSRRTKS